MDKCGKCKCVNNYVRYLKQKLNIVNLSNKSKHSILQEYAMSMKNSWKINNIPSKVNKHIQIKDLEIQEFKELSDEELSNIVGGFDAGVGGDGLACPQGGILGQLLCH